MAFRPLSKRGVPDDRFDEPQTGLPDYLFEPVLEWLRPLLTREDASGYKRVDDDGLRSLQTMLRLARPLDWRNEEAALDSLERRMHEDREFALDVVDFYVQVAKPEYADKLRLPLAIGGSEWEVVEGSEGRRMLARRTTGPIRQTIDAIKTDSQRAHAHLTTAWAKLTGRDPDPSAAYSAAIRAVEAVARPVVSPDNDRATLGTIIRDLRAKPEKWIVTLDKATAAEVADVADMIWRGQTDRHGTDDPGAPLAVTHAEADAAVHLAIPLTRMFAGGLVRRV